MESHNPGGDQVQMGLNILNKIENKSGNSSDLFNLKSDNSKSEYSKYSKIPEQPKAALNVAKTK